MLEMESTLMPKPIIARKMPKTHLIFHKKISVGLLVSAGIHGQNVLSTAMVRKRKAGE